MKKSTLWRIIYIILFIVPIITAFVFIQDIRENIKSESEKALLLCVALLLVYIFFDHMNPIIFSIKMLRRREYLIENGKKINIIVDKKYTNKRAFVYCKGKWLDKNSNIEYKFESIEYCADRKIKIPKKVDVYIDEENPKIYYMALEEAVDNLNKNINKEKRKYKIKLSFGLLINNIHKNNSSKSDIEYLIENEVDFKIEKAINSYLEVMFAYDRCYLLYRKIKKKVYGLISCDKNQVQSLAEEFYRNGKIEDLSNWVYDDIQQDIGTIEKIDYSLEDIKVDNDNIVLKDDFEKEEKIINISNITKVIKFCDSEYLVDINLILFTDKSRILLAYEENDDKINLSQIYKEIIDRNKKIKEISMEVNVLDLDPGWELF